MIPQLITNLTQAQVCAGNHDKNFISMSAERNGRFMSGTGNTAATEDIKDVKYNDQLISKTIRHVNCKILIPKGTRNYRCKQCQKYRVVLTAMYHRFKKKHHITTIFSSSHINRY